eukprot:m.81098 g.81098  ORF g.81098 m.81098 type:complete len:50 (+) comp14563_c0_seq1:3548-3697(+)
MADSTVGASLLRPRIQLAGDKDDRRRDLRLESDIVAVYEEAKGPEACQW